MQSKVVIWVSPKYFNALPLELQPKGKKLTPRAFKEINVKSPSKGTTKPVKPKTKTKSAPRPRTTLAPKKNSFNAPASEKGQHLLREATLIDANKLTISSAFVLRAFVELTVDDYMYTNKLPKKKKSKDGKMLELNLSQRAEAVIQEIVRSGGATNSDLRGFRNNVVSKSAASSIQSLNGFVHNKYQIPTPESVRAGWDCCVPVFEATYGKVG